MKTRAIQGMQNKDEIDVESSQCGQKENEEERNVSKEAKMKREPELAK